MIDPEPRALAGLDQLVPLPSAERADWSDVLVRASISRTRGLRLRRRHLMVAIAVVAAAVAVAVATPVGGALVRGLGDFSSWLTGEPGTPASRSDQQAFDRAQRTWLGFPRGTDLRQLIEKEVDGTTYTLFGFRVGQELCLRLIGRGQAAGGPTVSCAPLSELRKRKTPTLVVFVDYGVGRLPGKRVQVGPDTYTPVRASVSAGIVADGVSAVSVAGADGRRLSATVANNSFLAITERPKVGYRTRHVWATAAGRTVAIPFAQSPFGTSDLPVAWNRKPRGPVEVERHVVGGSVGWLMRREKRGAPVPPARVFHGPFGRVIFSRLITPDANSLAKVMLSLQIRRDPLGRRPAELQLCSYLVTRGSAGGGCSPPKMLFSRWPFAAGETVMGGGDQYATISGVASDDVARLELYLATGERLAVPLRDNAFLVQASRTKYPARLVAYDAQDRVIGVETLQEPMTQRGPHPAAHAQWKTLLTATSQTMTARLLTAPSSSGQRCFAIHWGTGGAGMSGCEQKRWGGPPLQVYFNEPYVHGNPTPLFLAGHVRPGIVRVEVHLPDGKVIDVRPTDGFVLQAVPVRYRGDGHKGAYAIGFDAAGNRLARGHA